jgi:endonuclease/exonuclease/phosphatase family metal-dependent hydrolase
MKEVPDKEGVAKGWLVKARLVNAGLSPVGMVLLGLCTGCRDDLWLPPAQPVATSVMTYNTYSLPEGSEREQVALHVGRAHPDFVATQECGDCAWLVEQVPAYSWIASPRIEVSLLYLAARWTLLDQGQILLGDNDDGWGPRYAVFGRFVDGDGAPVDVYSTHFCVTVRRENDACDADRQLEYVDKIISHLSQRPDPEVPFVVAGDLNVFDGFEHGVVIQRFREAGLADAYRVANPVGDGETFEGSSWAPAGRIDYIFTSQPVLVTSGAVIDDDAEALGSDHDPVQVEVSLQPRRPL